MGEVIQLQGDQRKDVQEFLTSEDGLGLKGTTIKVRLFLACLAKDNFQS
jgi:translation initiation factor 1